MTKIKDACGRSRHFEYDPMDRVTADTDENGVRRTQEYDAGNRQWTSMDPVKDGGNWYQYCYSNPATYIDPLGLEGFSPFGCGLNELKSQFDKACGDIKDWAKQV